MSNSFDKFAILESFLDEVTSYLPEIGANLDALQQRPGDTEVIEETYRRTHTIAGSAAMMEFGSVAHVAQGMEDLLGAAIDGGAALTPPAIALLRRSLSRLSQLVEHIRSGADDAPIVADDDRDRAALRGPSGAAASGTFRSAAAGAMPMPAAGPAGSPPSAGAGGGIQMPDWLAAFADPAASPPSAPVSPSFGPANGGQPASGPLPGSLPSAYPMYSPGSQAAPAGSATWGSSLSDLPTGRSPVMPGMPAMPGGAPGAGFGASATWQQAPRPDSGALRDDSASTGGQQPSLNEMLDAFRAGGDQYDGTASNAGMIASGGDMPGAYGAQSAPWAPASSAVPNSAPASVAPVSALPVLRELREDEEIARRHVATLGEVGASLREAAQAMEDERAELRQFLDGTRDALERLEDWAGEQMGLDLKHSPDSVRRYLPLSVIWVTTARLKRLIGLLNTSGRSLSDTQEQIEEALGALRTALEGAGQMFGAMTALGGAPDSGFTATVARFAWAPPPSASPSAPLVEAPAMSASAAMPTPQLSAAQRAALERSVREELRRELEDDVRAEIAAEVRRDEEDRLRQELQIQVRRELLSGLTAGAAGAAEGGVSALSGMLFSAERAPKPVRVTSEQSPEALEVFRDEALEHLQTITTGIAQLETTPEDVPTIQSIRRAMHTLKGAAGMMGFVVIQQLAHVSEDLLDRLVDGAVAFTPTTLALLLDTSETLDRFVSATGGDADAQQETLRTLTARYAQLTGGQVAEAGEGDALTVRDDAVVTGRAEDAAAPAGAASTADLSVRLQLRKLDDLVNLFGELLVNRSILEERLDRLGRFVNDTVVVSERLREVGDQLESRFEAATLPSGRGDTGALPGGVNGRERQGPAPRARGRAAPPSFGGLRDQPAAHTSEFDELELDRYTEFHRLSRGLGEGVADVVTLGHEMDTLIKECLASFARENRLSSELQDRLLKARLVPLQSLVPRLYRTVRASALKEGKEIEFYAEGTETEVDRKVIEEVAGPMLHLVRNAVNHGIERPNAREMAGKPSAGSIIVSAAYEGNQVVISVRDDGAGIDPERIRAAAVARGLIDAYTNLSDREAINLIFKPGVTTADTVTEESGRGVGLDVVRDMVARFRGTLEVDSSPGQGTMFTMKFPISLQIARALLVKVGPQTLAIPMVVVDQIDRLERFSRISGDTAAIDVRGERYPVAHLASYLKLESGPVEDRSTVLLVNAGRRRVALLVDGIVSQQEIVSKPLGPHLRDVPGVAGAAVLGNGQVVVILELHELLAQQPHTAVVLPPRGSGTRASASASSQIVEISQMRTDPVPAVHAPPSAPSTPHPAIALPPAAAPATPRREFVVAPRPTDAPTHHRVTLPASAQRGFVLVVDDSPSVRRVVSNMLKANGWEVQTARDGMEALDVIARQAPAAVLLDIEMPRMDGYELMATVRSQEQYSHLPLIVLTSRAATKHQTRAVQLGADAYVVKPYQDEELLNTIATLVRARQG